MSNQVLSILKPKNTMKIKKKKEMSILKKKKMLIPKKKSISKKKENVKPEEENVNPEKKMSILFILLLFLCFFLYHTDLLMIFKKR